MWYSSHWVRVTDSKAPSNIHKDPKQGKGEENEVLYFLKARPLLFPVMDSLEQKYTLFSETWLAVKKIRQVILGNIWFYPCMPQHCHCPCHSSLHPWIPHSHDQNAPSSPPARLLSSITRRSLCQYSLV